LRIAEINALLALNELVKAESLVEKLLVTEPKNVDALLVAGTLYGKISQADSTQSEAKSNAQILARQESTFNRRKTIYQRVLTLQPDNFTANYNLGIILYNRSIDLVKSQNFDVDAIKLHSILEKTTAFFKEALPYMNKANQLAPNDKNTMMALEGIYYNLNEKEKSAQMRVKIDSLN
jgi:tetratricopeptide (TPR) repeat protein